MTTTREFQVNTTGATTVAVSGDVLGFGPAAVINPADYGLTVAAHRVERFVRRHTGLYVPAAH